MHRPAFSTPQSDITHLKRRNIVAEFDKAAAKWENTDLHLGVPFVLRDLREGTASKVEEIKRKAREER